MDISTDLTPNTTAPATASVNTPEPESEAPIRLQPTKPSSNGVLKRHHHPLHHHPYLNDPTREDATYRECLRNHAANLGGHAVDGCGEFMPSPVATPADPTSLKCAACGCHRNFHRRDPEEAPAHHVVEYRPHHRHHPPPPRSSGGGHISPNSASPPPISSSYYPASAPRMLMALSAGLPAPPPENNRAAVNRKRFRTKFSEEQKQRMFEFAERLGWKMQRRDEDSINDFCNEVGVERGVFKVWMHNNKNTFGKRLGNQENNNGDEIGNRNSPSPGDSPTHHHDNPMTDNSAGEQVAPANGSSSSS